MSSGEPSAYAHFLTHFGNHFSAVGTQGAWLLAVASLVIGVGPSVARRPRIFLLAGGLLSLAFWITGQGPGRHLHGVGHRPQHRAPGRPPRPFDDADHRSRCFFDRPPLASLLRRNPVLAIGGGVGLVVALVLSAAYPAPAQETTGMAMAGMAGMSGVTPAEDTASSASCTAGNGGTARSGLDLTNSPYMIMGGDNGMNMNGADASAAAGFNSTKANWSYTGPALPHRFGARVAGRRRERPRPDPHGGHRVRSRADVLPGDQRHPVRAVHQRGGGPYANLAAATAAGYVAVSPSTTPSSTT